MPWEEGFTYFEGGTVLLPGAPRQMGLGFGNLGLRPSCPPEPQSVTIRGVAPYSATLNLTLTLTVALAITLTLTQGVSFHPKRQSSSKERESFV